MLFTIFSTKYIFRKTYNVYNYLSLNKHDCPYDWLLAIIKQIVFFI